MYPTQLRLLKETNFFQVQPQAQFQEYLNRTTIESREIVKYKYMPEWVRSNAPYLYIWNNVFSKDKDGLIQVVGERGDCKSGFAMRFAYDMDVERHYIPEQKDWYFTRRFDLTRVCFLASEVSSLYRQDLPKGTCIVWDEAGVDNSSDNSYLSQKSKLLKILLETNRYKNYILLMTAPVVKSISITSRRLFNAFVEMQGKENNEWAKGYFRIIKVSAKTGKEYHIAPRYTDLNGNPINNSNIYVKRMPTQIENEYKKRKKYFTQNWYNLIEKELSFMKEFTYEEKGVSKSNEKYKEEILDNVTKYFDYEKNKFDSNLIHFGLNLSISKARVLTKVLNHDLAIGNIIV